MSKSRRKVKVVTRFRTTKKRGEEDSIEARITKLEEKFKNQFLWLAQQVGLTQAHVKVLAESLDALDTNVLAYGNHVIKEVMARLVLINDVLMDQVQDFDKLPANPEKLHEDTQKWFSNLLTDGVRAVTERKKQEEEDRKRAAEAAKKEQEDTAKAQKVEAELKAAESTKLVTAEDTAGPGSDIPEGAQVFGGTG